MYRRILIVVSERPEARAAVTHGIELARVHAAEVFLLSVLPRYIGSVAELTPVAPMPPSGNVEREVHRQAERLLTEAGTQAEHKGLRSTTLVGKDADAVACITEAARDHQCDLIVAGTEQRNAVMRILTGSVIPGLITQAPVPVLVCHQPTPAATRWAG